MFFTKLSFVCMALILLSLQSLSAQEIAPEGKYNTTNYPKDRKAIDEISSRSEMDQHYNDDYIAVGPEGRVSYGIEAWKKRLYRCRSYV